MGGGVSSVSVYDMGYGYSTGSEPRVIIAGDGRGAAAHAVVQDGVILAIEIDASGTGYTVTPRIAIASPPFTPEIRIQVQTVRVDMRLILGERYRLETSKDLSTWVPVGQVFSPDEELFSRSFNVQEFGQFFRVLRISPLP